MVFVPVLVDTPMVDVPTSVSTVDSASLELATFRAFLERAGVPTDGVATMDEALLKLASVLSSHSVGPNETVSVDCLKPPASE